MKTHLVMTAIGSDRPGLVEAIAGVVAEHGGNWLESRMCRLGGEFAGIVRVALSPENREALLGALRSLETDGLKVVVHKDGEAVLQPGACSITMDITGQDQPGIVHRISKTLADHGVNVEELETECVSAPMSGEPIFKAHARLQVPQACDMSKLRDELETLAGDLFVDLTLGD